MPATGIAISAFVLAVVVLIGGSVMELRNLKKDR